MLLSDRDIRAEITAGRLGIDPFDDSLVQPSSVDVRLDNLFRVFNNTRYTHIDPALRQDELTTLVEPKEGEPFVLHPGEFVLGSTLERCTLPDDLAGRLEGKSSLGRLGLLTHSTAGFIDPGLHRPHHPRAVQRRQPADHAVAGHEDRPAVPAAADQPRRASRTAARKVGSKYQGQRGPTPSKSYQNFIKSTEDVTPIARDREGDGAVSIVPSRLARTSAPQLTASAVTTALVAAMNY